MRHPIFAIFAIALVLLSACGKEYTKSNMSQDQALEALNNVPMQMEQGRGAFRTRNTVSAEGLVKLLQQLIDSGQLKVPQSGRGAIGTSGFDLNSLMTVFSLLQGGGLMGLANGMVNTSGSTAGAKFDLTSIIALLNSALPIITAIAPQYAAIVQALVVILPIVITFINMFKKPKAALNINWMPVTA